MTTQAATVIDALALAQLIARVEAATGADREIDCAIALAVDGFFVDGEDYRGRPLYCYMDGEGQVSPGQGHAMLVRPYTASLDAALALVERCKPGWYWRVGHTVLYDGWAHIARTGGSNTTPGVDEFGGTAKTPALALILAMLRALAALAETPG